MKPRIEIHKGKHAYPKGAKIPKGDTGIHYYVRYKSRNGEILSSSETLETVAACKKNIKSVAKIFKPSQQISMYVSVMDYTENNKGKLIHIAI